MIVCNPMVNKEILAPHAYKVNYNNLPLAREVVLSLGDVTAFSGHGKLLTGIVTQTIFGQKVGLISMSSKGQMYLIFDLGTNVFLRKELTTKCKMRKKDLVSFKSDEYKKAMGLFNSFFEEATSREGISSTRYQEDPTLLTQHWVNCWDITPETKSKIRFASEPKRVKE